MAKNAKKIWPKIGAFGECLEFLEWFGVFERSGVVWSILERPDEVGIG